MARKIGVIYCGGCNPAYDRVGMMSQVRSRLGTFSFVSGRDEKDPDLLLYVNGCQRACVEREPVSTRAPIRSIVSNEEFESLIDWLSSETES